MTTKGFSILIYKNTVQITIFFKMNTYDSVYVETEDVLILIEGIVLNKTTLLTSNAESFEEYLIKNYLHLDWKIIQQLEGEFRGCIWDKRKGKLLIFTNPTSTQRVFYTKHKDNIFIDTDLVRLTNNLKQKLITLTPDITSLYQLLTIGNLLENRTPIQNIYKLRDSHYLDIDIYDNKLIEKEYFNLSNLEYYNGSKENAINNIHDIFTEAVKWEYDKDIELGTSHLSLLSGGLDSRMALLYAIKNNYKIGQALCFSHSGYLDEKISKAIAKDYNIGYESIPLNKGDYLKKIDELTIISEGTSLYTGGIHVKHAIENLAFKNFSIFHGGQIGDGILGGFNSEPKRKAPSQYKIIVNQKFLPKIENNLKEVMSNYEREEIFLLKNLAYNRTVLGAQVMQPKAYLLSPFMTKDYIKLAVSLPEEWKYKHKFYIKWLNTHCKEASNYKWERTLMKPNAYWKVLFGDKFLVKTYQFYHGKILKSPQKASMYPYQYYYESSMELQNYYQKYFDNNIEKLESYPELKSDVIELFSQKNFYQKCMAINILSIFKLYFS